MIKVDFYKPWAEKKIFAYASDIFQRHNLLFNMVAYVQIITINPDNLDFHHRIVHKYYNKDSNDK